MIRALFFDFDGTLWDSETAGLQAWTETYAAFGLDFPLEVYLSRLGTIGGRDPIDELAVALGYPLDRDQINEQHQRRKADLLAALKPRPGVLDYLREARTLGLALAVVSTDDTAWITKGLATLGLLDRWDFIECAEGDPLRAKPSPALYLAALRRLGLSASEAIAIEDSPNGIRAAKGAGLYCLVTPHGVSAELDLSAADARVESLAELPLRSLLDLAQGDQWAPRRAR